MNLLFVLFSYGNFFSGLFFLHGYRVQANVTFNLDKQQQQQQSLPPAPPPTPQQLINQTQQLQQSSITAESRQHIFEIVPSDSKYRHIWLCADSESDRKRYVCVCVCSLDTNPFFLFIIQFFFLFSLFLFNFSNQSVYIVMF